jgi:hypothetical protein
MYLKTRIQKKMKINIKTRIQIEGMMIYEMKGLYQNEPH